MLAVNRKKTINLLAVLSTMAITSAASASSHREAPAIGEDQFADNTDVYAFISPGDASKLTLVANYVPLLIPSSGPNFYKFSDHVRYEIAIDNDGDAQEDVTYQWRFTTSIQTGTTFLYNTGAIDSLTDENLNVRQVYDLVRIAPIARGADTSGCLNVPRGPRLMCERLVASNVPVAPWYVGDRSFPNRTYEGVAAQAVHTTDSGISMFAGPRDEPFFVDLHVFDLLGVAGAPTTDGINVMSLVLEVPITDLAAGGQRPAMGEMGPTAVVGIHARSSRRAVTIRGSGGDLNFGNFTQVSRLGWPLVNEVIIPLQDKDKYNRSLPVNDVQNFGSYILDPEVPKLLSAVLGLDCPAAPAGGRVDIVGLLSPNGTTAADLLRINITANQTNEHSAFPNGRGLEDDVTDTLLTVACNNGAPIGDGVNGNDRAFTAYFPYLASPHSGNPID